MSLFVFEACSCSKPALNILTGVPVCLVCDYVRNGDVITEVGPQNAKRSQSSNICITS